MVILLCFNLVLVCACVVYELCFVDKIDAVVNGISTQVVLSVPARRDFAAFLAALIPE